jgi:AraC-like DNA-binding protein
MLRSQTVAGGFPLPSTARHPAAWYADPKPTFTTIRASSVSDFGRVARSVDLDPIALMKRVGINPRQLDDCDVMLPMRAVNDLFELAAYASGMDDFGLRFAELRGLPDLGPVTLVLREEETFRAALQTLIAFLHLHSDAAYITLREGEHPILTIDILLEGLSPRRQVHDGSVASVVNLMRWLLGERWSPATVCFMHSRPMDIGRFEAFFRCPIDFNYEFNGIVLRRQDLDERLPASSPAMRRHLQRYLQTIGGASGQSYVQRVTQVIGLALSRGEGRVNTVARHLGVDPRTLNRRLAKGGVNYSTLLENIRRNIAVQHLRDGDRLLSDIAGLVGFSSLSAFSSWFHEAFACAPSAWRKNEKHSRGVA